MKKWYLITGILAVLWLISLGTCSSNSAEVDRLKDEVAELTRVKAELNELQTSYNTLLSEYNKLQGGTGIPAAEEEAPPSETQIQQLPYSWTEGVFLITIEEFLEYDEPGWGENYNWYKLCVSYKNASHKTTKADIHIGTFKLKTDEENLYDIKYSGCLSCDFTLDPEQSYKSDSCSFRIQKGEKPVELWLYKTIGEERGWPKYAEEPSIIFKLET